MNKLVKSIDEINFLFEQASLNDKIDWEAKNEPVFEKGYPSYEAVNGDIDLASEQAAKEEWDEFVKENGLTYEDVSRGW